jgi:hypothetical protein
MTMASLAAEAFAAEAMVRLPPPAPAVDTPGFSTPRSHTTARKREMALPRIITGSPVCQTALLLAAVLLLLTFSRVGAQSTSGTIPGWWTTYGVLNGNPPNDFAAANIGQAKQLAVTAVYELDNDLAQFGGAGATLDNLAATLLANESGTIPQLNDFAAVNLGQLKTLSQPFYDRLLSLGYYGPPLSIVTGTGPATSGTYPWVISGLPANDFAAANIGQLKYLFSFDVNYSTYGTEIPDWWLRLYGLPLTTSTTAYVPWSGDQVTYQQAFDEGLNPVNFYNPRFPSWFRVHGESGRFPGRLLPDSGFTSRFLPGTAAFLICRTV